MFAPKVTNPQTKATEDPTSRLALERSTLSSHGYGRDPIGHALFLQRAIGNQATMRLLAQQASRPVFPSHRASQARPSFSPPIEPFAGTIQEKLDVGAVDDPLEREADRVAEHVMRTPNAVTVAPPAVMGSAVPAMQRKCSCGGTCAECSSGHADEEHRTVHRKPAGPQVSRLGPSPASSGMTAPPTVHQVLNSPGRPLDAATRAFMEPRFGYDFSAVRMHTGSAARNSAAEIGALAYTVGPHVVLREESPPHQLLAHELAHVVQQASAPARLVQRGPGGGQKPPPPQRPALAARLNIIEESGAAIQPRLNEIIHTGRIPDGTRMIGAMIVDIKGYQGPREVRAISSMATDDLGVGAQVYHATSPKDRTLSATTGIAGSGPRRDFPFKHMNDVEVKLFEDLIHSPLPKDAEGTIHFITVRVRHPKGQAEPVFEEFPACSGCIRASFEASGTLVNIDVVSHAPVHPSPTLDFDKAGHVDQDEPAITNPRGLKPKTVNMSPRDADVDQATGLVVPGPNTDAARARRAAKASQPGHSGAMAIEFGTGAVSLLAGYLASYLKGQIDQKKAAAQTAQSLAAMRTQINGNPDEALKAMMSEPEKAIYAWAYLDDAVITTIESSFGEPNPVESSPIILPSKIEYRDFPVDPSQSQFISGFIPGGRSFVTVNTIIISLPLETLPLETLIDYAKQRNLPLDALYAYASKKYQPVLSDSLSFSEDRQFFLNHAREAEGYYQDVLAQYQDAKKHHDVRRQKFMEGVLNHISKAQASIAEDQKTFLEHNQNPDQELKYWQHILDLLKPAKLQPPNAAVPQLGQKAISGAASSITR
jgi:Domain of unknown function (DUF4157)